MNRYDSFWYSCGLGLLGAISFASCLFTTYPPCPLNTWCEYNCIGSLLGIVLWVVAVVLFTSGELENDKDG